ncbi:MAG: methylthioribulose-1-phosphate dehydratase [Kiritimatiellia bacterium]|jgi:methylthioribulose-1-phosphate dehydratase
MSDLRDELAEVAATFYHRGWMHGTSGNLSARLPDGTFWVTASGVAKGHMTRDQFLRMTVDGEILERMHDGVHPSAETSLHQATYAMDSSAGACLHVHTIEANLLTRMGDPYLLPLAPIEMIKGFGVWEFEPRMGVQIFDNVLHVRDIAVAMAERWRDEKPEVPVVLIRDHGMSVWGKDLQEAVNRVEVAQYVFRYMVEARSAGVEWWR